MTAVTLAAAPTGTSQARRRPIRRRTGLGAGNASRPGIGPLSAWAPSGDMIAREFQRFLRQRGPDGQ